MKRTNEFPLCQARFDDGTSAGAQTTLQACRFDSFVDMSWCGVNLVLPRPPVGSVAVTVVKEFCSVAEISDKVQGSTNDGPGPTLLVES